MKRESPKVIFKVNKTTYYLAMAIITVQNLSKHFGSVKAVADISFNRSHCDLPQKYLKLIKV